MNAADFERHATPTRQAVCPSFASSAASAGSPTLANQLKHWAWWNCYPDISIVAFGGSLQNQGQISAI
jgi:hypothetical protein